MSFSLRTSSGFDFSSGRGPSAFASILRSSYNSADAFFENLRTICLNTLKSTRSDLRSITIVGTRGLRMASAVSFATSDFLGLITWPG